MILEIRNTYLNLPLIEDDIDFFKSIKLFSIGLS